MFDKHPAIQRERMNAILKSILDNQRITRNKLAGLLKLSPSSIVKYNKILKDKGLVRETDREQSTGGRRSILLELNPEAGLSIAIVLNVSSVRGVLINTVGKLLGESAAVSYQGIPKEDLLGRIFEVIDDLLSKARTFQRRIFGIGIGLGGFIDPILGISHEFLYAKSWYDVPLKQIVETRYGISCFLVNDANACALGEKYSGMGVGVDHFLCVWIGEGIGMGIVANGELYMGKSYYAGEFGHTHALNDGQLCYCGHMGCLETICSQQYILSQCRDGLSQGVNSEVLKYCGNDLDRLTIEDVIIAANNGDRFTRNIFAQAGEQLGTKLSDIANIFNPELIILRGSVIDGNEFLFESVKRIVLDLSLRPTAKSLQILYSKERADIRFVGIGSAILNDYFSR